MLSQPESFSITLKGSLNPTVYHPTWYYTIGQLSKDDATSVVNNTNVHVSPNSTSFSAPSFSIECDKKRWQVKTHDRNARLRILNLTVKTFDDLLPETRLKQFGFTFVFCVEAVHEITLAYLSSLVHDLVPVEGKGEIATTILFATSTDPVSQRKVRIQSLPGVNKALLTFSFVYALPEERIFTLKQMSIAEDYELDYEEAVTRAEQIAYKLMNVKQQERKDNTVRGN